MRHYAGWELYIGEKLLSLWRSEDVEWSTTFYHATLCQLRVYNGKLTHLSVRPVFRRCIDLLWTAADRGRRLRLMPCLRVCDAQLKFESDEVESRDVPIEFALRPKNDRHVAIKRIPCRNKRIPCRNKGYHVRITSGTMPLCIRLSRSSSGCAHIPRGCMLQSRAHACNTLRGVLHVVASSSSVQWA